jgi:hypothetical protein
MRPTMAATLPADLRAVFDRFITTEYVTVDGRGQPIAWPVTPYPHDDGDGTCIDVTTGLGYPKKARDAQRNPKVALLFSDPTGSGLEDPPAVLVQGTARVDDDDLQANADRYLREGAVKLPKASEKMPPEPLHRFLRWYLDRIYVHVKPERVLVWPGGDIATAPQVVLGEPLPGATGETVPPVAQSGWEPRLDQLGSTYPTAVLALVGADGFPIAVRVPVRPDRAAGLVRLTAVPAGIPLAPGRACLTAHAHGPEFEWQQNFQVRGPLAQTDDGWALEPRRLVGGFEIPQSQIAVLRENFRKVMRYRKIAKAEHARRANA